MNPQIRELVKQAGGHFSTRNLMSNPVQHIESVELWDDKIEKFYELIIRECMLLSILQSEASYVSNYIAKHFGLDK
jgi:hypothetical protein